MTQTVNAAVTAEGYPMLGSDGTLARRIYTDVNGVQRVSIADTAINVAQNGTWTVQPGNTPNTVPWLVTVNSNIAVSVQNAITQGGTWTVQPGNTANTTPWLVSVNSAIAVSVQNLVRTTDVPAATGGNTIFSQMVSNNTTGISVKGAAGQVYGIHAFNIGSTPLYLKLYDKATAPTVGSDVIKARYVIPGNTAGAGFSIAIPGGAAFPTGIGMGITGGITANDTTAPGADIAYVNVYYT
jgi:hypothetical protein